MTSGAGPSAKVRGDEWTLFGRQEVDHVVADRGLSEDEQGSRLTWLYHSRVASLIFMIWLLLIVILAALKREKTWTFEGWPTMVLGFGSMIVVAFAILDTVMATVLERKATPRR